MNNNVFLANISPIKYSNGMPQKCFWGYKCALKVFLGLGVPQGKKG